MKQILVISMIIISVIGSYFFYTKYQNSLELEYYIGSAEERALILSFVLLDEKSQTNKFKKYIIESIFFDLRAINENNEIKNRINVKHYCENILYAQVVLHDFNTSTKKIINQICHHKTLGVR